MKKILFVCHGNICRSPMAEFVFREIARQNGREHAYAVASRATSGEEIFGGVGNPVYPPAKAELARHGLRCEGKRAIRLRASDYEDYDLLIGMDRMNLRNMQQLFGGDPQNKLRLLLDFTTQPGEVSDPWYTRDFARCYDDILRGCRGLFDTLEKTGA